MSKFVTIPNWNLCDQCIAIGYLHLTMFHTYHKEGAGDYIALLLCMPYLHIFWQMFRSYIEKVYLHICMYSTPSSPWSFPSLVLLRNPLRNQNTTFVNYCTFFMLCHEMWIIHKQTWKQNAVIKLTLIHPIDDKAHILLWILSSHFTLSVVVFAFMPENKVGKISTMDLM